MSDDDQEAPWFERSPLFDLEAAEKFGTGVYRKGGKPRDRGVFTHADREYIIGEREFKSPQHRSNVRSKQLQRITDSFDDVPLLLLLDDRTKERFFDELSPLYAHHTLRDFIRFFYEGMGLEKEIVKDAVLSAIWESESVAAEHDVMSVDVEITIEQGPNLETALEMIEEGEYHRLTFEQIGALARKGLLDADDWEKLDWSIPEDSPILDVTRDNGRTDEED